MDRIYIRRKADGKIVFQKPATQKNAERIKFLLNKQCPARCYVDSYEVDKPDNNLLIQNQIDETITADYH